MDKSFVTSFASQPSFHGESVNDLMHTFSPTSADHSHDELSVVVVFVTTGEQHVVNLPISATAGDVRATLQLNSWRRLYFSGGGIELEDDHVLEDCGVVTQSTLLLVDDIAPDGTSPHLRKESDDPDPKAQPHVTGKFFKLMPLEDEGKMFRQNLSQLLLDKSLLGFDCRRGLSILFDV